MAHQPDVQKQQQHEQHQRLQDQPNIVYIQQNPQNYRNQNYQYPYEGQNHLIGNQPFQQQNASLGQFESNYPFVSNGHFSPSNSSTTIISHCFDPNKNKNGSTPFRNTHYLSENSQEAANCQQRNEAGVQFSNANYQSVDLQSLNYQQSSQFFLPNIRNQYQFNDILVPTYQSSGSSESSDESSVSNASQQNYSSDSGIVSNNQFEFPVPIPTANQVGQNFQQFQQKDFLDNYMAVLHQDNQIPRCDSSKSEAAESTCSSLSSGSTESQSENENIVRLPVLVNPVLNNNENCNVLHPYQTNTHNNITSCSNQMHHNQANDLNNRRNYNSQPEQSLLKCTDNYASIIAHNNVPHDNIGGINNVLPANNQMNNLVVMLPNRLNKNIQNSVNTNQAVLQNPPSPDVSNSSKFVIQNQKLNQEKVFGLINVSNQMSHEKMNSQVQINQLVKLNNNSIQESLNNVGSNLISSRSCDSGNFNGNEDQGGCNVGMLHSVTNSLRSGGGGDDIVDNCTSQIKKTSDSSVINSSYIQNNFSGKSIKNESNSAMLLKETSDKSISQCISDVNSSVVDSNNVYLVKNDENDIIKNVCYNDSSATSCLASNSSIVLLAVPVGWRRLLVDGSIIYLSPSNVALSSIEQVKMYLQTIGTCKCGLECPVNCDSVFNFNPKVLSRPWDSSDSELTRLCNHKRKAPVPGSSVVGTENFRTEKLNRKEAVPTKRKKKKHGSSCSGVSVSQLLAQRDRALAEAAARWSTTVRPGNVSYQNMPPNQYQSIQVLRNQTQDGQLIPYENKGGEGFKQEAPSPRIPDDKAPQFSCINVINSAGREGTVLNINGVNQLLPENHSAGHEIIRSSQMNLNSGVNQRQEAGHGVISNAGNYGHSGQEFMQNPVMAPRPEGVVLTPQGMLFPPNMVMQRPRSIPPWHQTRLGLNKKPAPETPVVYERVPYIQQHMPPPSVILEDSGSRKKHKTTSKTKKVSQEPAGENQPSFMDNPSAYLAQQTALLHNTISRPNLNMTPDSQPVTVLPQNLQNVPTSTEEESAANTSSATLPSNVLLPSSLKNSNFSNRSAAAQKLNQSNFGQDNADMLNKMSTHGGVEVSQKANLNPNYGDVGFNNHVCSNTNCAECKKSCLFDNRNAKGNDGDSQMRERIRLIQENLEKSNSEIFNQQMYSKNGWRQMGAPVNKQIKQAIARVEDQRNSIEENPVTSSTEKAPIVYNQEVVSDSRPIQGGTISTSNGSPQPQASPNSSFILKQEILSPKCSELSSPNPATGNMLISSSTNSSMAASHSVCSSVVRENENGLAQFKSENSSNKDGMAGSHSFEGLNHRSVSPDGNQRHKFGNLNFMNVSTSSDQKFKSKSDNQEDQGKAQSVTSTFDFQKEESKKDKSSSETRGNRFVRTMASGHTVSSNTITSVQAGKTQTATVTVTNNSSTPPTTISLVNFSNNPNLPVGQKGNTKSPLEMVQSVVSSIQTSPALVKNEIQPNVVSVNKTVLPTSNVLNNMANISTSILSNNGSNATPVLKTSPGLQAGHILVSSNGQYIVASSGNIIPQTNLSGLKLNQTSPVSPISASPVVTSVTGAVTQVLPAVGVAQQVLGQPTVLVNALPAPFVIQPGMMAVDTGLGRLAVASGNVLQSSLIENNALRNSIRGVNSPEKVKNKKGNKKRKNQVASLVQVTSPNNVILNQPFNQQNFAVSPSGNIQPLQALTLVQGKHGAPTQIVMNNQNNFNHFNTQPQQINLLQPVNLASVPNFPAFQQFIVPGLGNMVMSTDGTTTILPDTNIGVQLQLQNVNGQNVLTPVQNTSFINGQGILTTPAGMLIRAPNNHQKIIQNNSSPQFLSPNNSQFLVNQFQGQLSPLIAANLSPNQQIFTSSPPRQSPQEFIQIIPTSSSQNTTVVQQNTTIVQQQTTMVSNNQNILNNSGKSNFILNSPSVEKPIEVQIMGPSHRQAQLPQTQRCGPQEKLDLSTQHSVSTQTVINKDATNVGIATNNTFCQTLNSSWSGSPPDTTTHSPVESESNHERGLSPSGDGTSEDCLPQAMVQYVSSSINESENESETYLLSRIPKLLATCDSLPRPSDKPKNVVESSTILQEAGVQIQIGSGYVPSRRHKSTDECVVSSHSDVNLHEKRLESQSNITSYQEDKAKLMDALLGDARSDDLDQETNMSEVQEKLAEGDLVWGPVRGFLAWPGKLVGPIGPGGKALVRWFGGHSSPTRVNISQLQSLSQGLEAHHRASNKGRKNRRLNIELEAAIQEAMLELDKMTAQQKKVTSGNGRPRRSHR